MRLFQRFLNSNFIGFKPFCQRILRFAFQLNFRRCRPTKFLLTIFLAAHISTASAMSLISIDMDPSTAGIQSSLITTVGSSFTVDIVYTGDGITMFDAFVLDVLFNDTGPTLGLTGGTGMAMAGSIAGSAPLVIDVFSAIPVLPGAPLATGPIPPPFVPFASNSGLHGMDALGFPFFAGPIAAGVTVDLFSLTFDALAPGMSLLDAFTPPFPAIPIVTGALKPGGLSMAGAPIPAGLAFGKVTVRGIPEPSTLLLLVLAVTGLFIRHKKSSL